MTGEFRAGGCQCGQVRYRVRLRSRNIYACHCKECQKQSASAFGLSAPVHPHDLRLEGATQLYERPAHSGSVTRCYFCPNCGTRLYHQDAASELVSLKVGSLDDAGGLRLVAHLWVSRKQPWLRLDPDLPTSDTQPEDLAVWRRGLVEGDE